MEICKKLGHGIGNIKWTKPEHETELWPTNKWSTFGNPSQKITEEFRKDESQTKNEILKEFIMLFFLSRKIDIRAHVDQGEKDMTAKL